MDDVSGIFIATADCAAAYRGATADHVSAPDVRGVPASAHERSTKRAHEHERVARLMREYRPVVERALRRLGIDASRADDATQDVFITVARKLDFIRPGSEKPYVLGVAARVAANYRRSRALRLEIPDEALLLAEIDLALPADQQLERKRVREMLGRALASMSRELRTVFVLYEMDGLPMTEIADVVGVPVGTVASRLRRARGRFGRACGVVFQRTAFEPCAAPARVRRGHRD